MQLTKFPRAVGDNFLTPTQPFTNKFMILQLAFHTKRMRKEKTEGRKNNQTTKQGK
jgi:hypothetical protein